MNISMAVIKGKSGKIPICRECGGIIIHSLCSCGREEWLCGCPERHYRKADDEDCKHTAKEGETR